MDVYFVEVDADRLNTYVQIFKNERKVIYSNFFGASEHNRYEIAVYPNTILVRMSIDNFFRLYICSSNNEELKEVLSGLKNNIYVINIPSKKAIDNWIDLLTGTGFKYLARYDRYYNTQIEYRDSDIGTFACSTDIDGIYGLIHCGLFSEYTDYLPSKEEIADKIESGQVIVNKNDNKVLGVIIFTIEGKKCYLNLWIDRSGNGLYLLFGVYNIMTKKRLKYAYFWANSLNKKVIKIHSLMGARPDGLSDYSFIKG